MYESKISDAKWIAYDIPGNMGWIAFLAGLILCFAKKPEIMEYPWIFGLLLLDLLCGVVMLVGIGELISERLQKLDRVLPKKRLYRGFGALAFGGLAGMVDFSGGACGCFGKGADRNGISRRAVSRRTAMFSVQRSAVSGIQEGIRRSLKRAAQRKGTIWTLHAI